MVSKSTDELNAVLPLLVTVKTNAVCPEFVSTCVTSSIENVGAVIVIGVFTVSLSTVVETTAELLFVEVNIELAMPAVTVLDIGIIVPLVAL